MGKTKNILKKTLIVIFLLFVGSGLYSQENIDIEKTIGFVVKPKDYRIFKNNKVITEIDKLIVDKETEWGTKNKAFGTYAFNLKNQTMGFFIGDKLSGTGEIIRMWEDEKYLTLVVITEYKKKSVLVKYMVSLTKENEIDFICWWYNEEFDTMVGEISEKIRVDFVEE